MTKSEILRRLRDNLTRTRAMLPVIRTMPASSHEVGVDVKDLERDLAGAEAELADTIDQLMGNRYATYNHRQAILAGTVGPRGDRASGDLAMRATR